jgi:two-component system, cell cycle sensor histidine kinase and response regulator CckA
MRLSIYRRRRDPLQWHVGFRSMSPPPLRILLIEHDDRFAQALGCAAASMRHPAELVRHATIPDGLAGLDAARFDAVLLAADLPDGSGAETLQRLRASLPAVPIVVLTAEDDPDQAQSLAQLGAQDHLVKAEVDGRTLARALRYAVERAAFRAELMRREQYFRALLENSYDIVVVLGPDGTFLYCSPAVERILGYAPADLAGTSVLRLVHPDDRGRAASLLSDWPGGFPDRDEFLFRLQHRSGSWRILEALGRPLEGDATRGLVVNARDVTDRVHAEEALRMSEAKLRQVHKMEAVGRLAGGIAHDFNNLLTAIYGYSDLLLDALDRHDPRRLDVEEIKKAAQRAAALTRQLLAFSRQQVLQPQVLDLNAVVEEAHRMIARLVGTDVQTTFEPGPELWRVRADKGQIEQVLMNLAGNARDAMPDGGALRIVTGNASLSLEEAQELPGLPPGDYVSLRVSDTGAGIPEAVRRHIFEPFFTTKEQGKGTGLGLATVYGIVKQSGGGIYVDSREGQGTTFTIYLPPHLPTSSP